jgi:hypothetical protein
MGRRGRARSSPRPCGPAQAITARALFSSAADTVAPLVGHLVPFLVAEPETITDPDPNPRTKGSFSQIDHANTLYKLESSRRLSFLDQTVSIYPRSSSCRRRNPRSRCENQFDVYVISLPP